MTELNCSLRSRQIALETDGVVVARRRKAAPLRLHPSPAIWVCDGSENEQKDQ